MRLEQNSGIIMQLDCYLKSSSETPFFLEITKRVAQVPTVMPQHRHVPIKNWSVEEPGVPQPLTMNRVKSYNKSKKPLMSLRLYLDNSKKLSSSIKREKLKAMIMKATKVRSRSVCSPRMLIQRSLRLDPTKGKSLLKKGKILLKAHQPMIRRTNRNILLQSKRKMLPIFTTTKN